VAKKVDNEESQDALVYASVAVARVKLSLNDTDGARKDLDDAERILDTFDSVETIVHAAFYDANASYYQVFAHPSSRVPSTQRQEHILISDMSFSARWTLPTTIARRCYTWLALTSSPCLAKNVAGVRTT
jgi:hypothetical protein